MPWKLFQANQGHRRYLAYRKARDDAARPQKHQRTGYEVALARSVKACPKAYFNYVQSKGKLRESEGSIELSPGTLAITAGEKAEGLLSYYYTNRTLPPRLVQEMPQLYITSVEVTVEPINLNKHRAACPDGLHPAIIQPLADILAPPVAVLFNLSLNQAVIPNEWKMAEVMPVFKAGRWEISGNYRPGLPGSA
ncbi:unnamed protein product [Echinostoma caproni]|uniref:CHASE domain-containing protein n=1 Tax=Echinostoma caproni TaxID=27848 RepID=A0A183A0D0_9TREM|nr:unnamed protein product [Echinostoma caproni]